MTHDLNDAKTNTTPL